MTADRRVQSAREYLDGARRRNVNQLPPSQLVRELAETRRALGQLLDVVDEAIAAAADDGTGLWLDGTATVSAADLASVLDALDLAAEYKSDKAAACGECDGQPDGGLCSTCEWRMECVAEYRALAGALRGAS